MSESEEGVSVLGENLQGENHVQLGDDCCGFVLLFLLLYQTFRSTIT